jgi:two-component system, cell cycle response regulator
MAGGRMPLDARNLNRSLVIAAQAVLGAGLVLLASHTLLGVGGNGTNELFDHWLYDGLTMSAALICLARVVFVSAERGAWLLIGLGLLGWALGDIYWTGVLSGNPDPPFPSVADAGYLSFYPLAGAGLVLLMKARLNRAHWLDGLIVALAVTAIGVEVLLDLVLKNADAAGLSLATSIAYPVGDILVLSFACALLVLTGRVPSRAWLLIIIGVAVTALADAIYSYAAYSGTYQEGDWIDLLWPLSAALIAFSAWEPAARESARPSAGWPSIAVPSAFTMLIAVRLGLDPLLPVYPAGMVVIAAMLTAIVARFFLAMSENHKLVERIETDPLTGLANRGKLLEDLRAAIGSGEPHVLGVYDLDGFKAYNDSFGHPAGDALLSRLGRRLGASVSDDGAAYRIGGDEFCVLLRGASNGGPKRAAEALSGHGDGFRITSSFGTVMLPEEATSQAAALQIADKRMYAQKDSRRLSAGGQAKAVLMRVLGERQPVLGQHVRNVSELAVAVGNRLGMDRGDLIVLARAAELHDIGKVAIPDAILDKPGPLNDEEWAFMKQHTILGERIISSAPALARVASVVRSSHENFGGGGYPDGLSGEKIPLASRVILACDAYEAMTSERPYAAALSNEAARRELQRCAGSQFDPQVIETLLLVLAEGRPAILTSLRGEAQTA